MRIGRRVAAGGWSDCQSRSRLLFWVRLFSQYVAFDSFSVLMVNYDFFTTTTSIGAIFSSCQMLFPLRLVPLDECYFFGCATVFPILDPVFLCNSGFLMHCIVVGCRNQWRRAPLLEGFGICTTVLHLDCSCAAWFHRAVFLLPVIDLGW